MSQQQRQQQQLLSHSVITALAQARIAHSMVALVRNPCRADSQSRATPRRANPRRVKPGPMRRWRHPTCSPTLPAPCAHTNTSLSPPLNLRLASREPPHRLPTGATLPRRGTWRSHSSLSDGLSRRFATRTASFSFRRASCHPPADRVSLQPPQPQRCRGLHPVAQPARPRA